MFNRDTRELHVSPAAADWWYQVSQWNEGKFIGQWLEANYLPEYGPGEIKLVVRWDWARWDLDAQKKGGV